MQLVDRNGFFKNWHTVKHEYDLKQFVYPVDATYKCHTI